MKLSYLMEKNFSQNLSDREIQNLTYKINESNENSLLFLVNDRDAENFRKSKAIAAAIVSEKNVVTTDNIINIKVENVRKALSLAYKRFYCDDLSGIRFVGITGTNGKSTTAILLMKILEDYGINVGLFGTGIIRMGDLNITPENYSMTTPPPDILYPTINMMKHSDIDVIIMEVSSHALSQERVFPINFEVGAFTNLSREHLDYHKSMTEYFDAKKKLFSKSKFKVVNMDDGYGRILASEYSDAYTIGTSHASTVCIKDIKDRGFDGSSFVYSDGTHEANVDLGLPGTYNVYNTALAISIAEKLGVPIESAKKSIEKTRKIAGRYNMITEDITVIIDYAHTEFAFNEFIKSLFLNKKPKQKITLVFGCGGERDKYKRYSMGAHAEKFADKVVITSDNPRNEDPMKIISDIVKSMHIQPIVIPDRASAIKLAINESDVGDIVAIIGKGPEKYTIENGHYIEFDEEKIVHEALNQRKSNNC